MATVRFIPYHDSIHHCLHKVLGQFGHAPATRLIHGQYTPPAKGRAAHERAPSLLASLHRHYSSALSPSVRVDTTGRQKRNSAPWTSEDDQALLRLREQGCTWGEVGRAMRKSRQACSHRFNTVLDPVLGDSFWRQDPHRSEILAALVHQKFSWKEIAQQLNTNASSCEHQWRVLQRRDVATENTTIAVNSGGTRSKLSRQDLERLQSAVQLHGTDQWETIAKETFDMAFTATYLRHQYIAQERKRQVWTMSQEEQLLLAVQKILDGDLEDISSCDRLICDQQWQRIAEQIQGKHTALECKNKWLKLKFLKAKREAKMSQSVSLGLQQDDLNLRITWTPEQTAALRALVEDMKTLAVEKQSEESFKIDWGMVADKMGRVFTSAQCKSKWVRLTRKSETNRTGPWQSQELESLVSCLCRIGPSWTRIHREHLSSRTPTFIQGKWKNMVAKIHQDMVVHQRTWSESCHELHEESLATLLQNLERERPGLCHLQKT